ncbi:hypothetical protein Cgig2_014049 [Carnegiea gigantea]|uniref:Terpene cyclase/mutase family member n=1 Tax=Carnegiea gigantea TaxID=171969 RepID=A0A9Q1KZB4_9CARY|nr:hypothetical protein Cgig2_014049 [Carnegiea gigantea]
MWKLKIAEGKEDPWLVSVNNYIGRQHWEFDPKAGTLEERANVERAREGFKRNRFTMRQSVDFLMRMQLRKENPSVEIPEAIKLEGTEQITEQAVETTLKRAVGYFSTIQAHDGHWPAESAGPLFLLPALTEDGGWGFHIEGQSTMFGSALNYITLRLLGEGPDDGEDDAMARGRRWILDHGGVIGKMLSYCRLVYLPMSYLYGKRFVAPITELIQSLRRELYTQPYSEIDWNKARNTCAKEDLYHEHPLVQDVLWGFLHHFTEPILNRWPFSKLREKALKTIMEHIHYEDVNSRYLCTACIEKVVSLQFEYNLSVIRENPSGNFKEMYRHISKGAWMFSIHDQGWQVSDSTAEGLKAAILLSQMSLENKIEEECLPKMEVSQLGNPKELSGGLRYVECTSSAIQSLSLFKKLYPTRRREEIEECISKGIRFIEESQNYDGSWYGCWGICFTYGTWFGVEALATLGGKCYNSSSLSKACEFLLSKQLPDGGWGESYLSCTNKVYTNLQGNRSNLVHTSWALLALMKAGQARAFMKNCILNYASFRNIFPIWALGEYRNLQMQEEISTITN